MPSLLDPPKQPTRRIQPMAATLPPLIELSHKAAGGEKLRAACIERADIITFAASLARDYAQ